MLTLPNSHHESFAQLLAQGYTPTFAYAEAGFNKRNAAARAPRLAKNPNIRARVKALKDALPRIQDLQARFAPSALLMPETKEHMGAILWQIGSGLRPILPVQLRALSLFCRLQGWHLTPRPSRTHHIPGMPWPKEKEEPATSPTPLTPEEQTLLTTLAQQIIAADQAHQPLAPELAQTFLAAMTDSLLTASTSEDSSDQTDQTEQTDPPDPSSTPTSPNPPHDDLAEYHNRIRAIVEHVQKGRAHHAAVAAASTGNPPNLHISSTSQTSDPQLFNPKNPKAGTIPRTGKDDPNQPEDAESDSDTLSKLLSALDNPPRSRPSPTHPTAPAPTAASPSHPTTPSKSPHDHWHPAFLHSVRTH